MDLPWRIAFFLSYLHLAYFTDPPCIIDLECLECIPDNMALVTSHRATNGSVTVPSGDELVLACSGGKFFTYPLLDTLTAVCEGGLYRIRRTGELKHLLELGCQENIFEDVLHQVQNCAAPLQGRAYQMQETGSRAVRHLATVCFDEDRALPAWVHGTNAPRNRLQLPPHAERTAPLSLLGNFNHMFDARLRHDADKLYSDDVRMNRRLREIFKHDRVSFAGQSLTSAALLSKQYFEDQNMRVAEFVSNRVAVWRGVAEGNLRNLQRDVGKLLELSRPHEELQVYAGTHAVLAVRCGHTRRAVYLKAGKRFPVPRYIWTVVHSARRQEATAIVLLNDPFVAVSEIKEAVFCESGCGSVSWLHELRRNRNYETPIKGLVFCCSFHNFTKVVTEMPKDEIIVNSDVRGLLNNLFV